MTRAVPSLIYAAVASPIGWQTYVGESPKPHYVRRRDDRNLWDTSAQA